MTYNSADVTNYAEEQNLRVLYRLVVVSGRVNYLIRQMRRYVTKVIRDNKNEARFTIIVLKIKFTENIPN